MKKLLILLPLSVIGCYSTNNHKGTGMPVHAEQTTINGKVIEDVEFISNTKTIDGITYTVNRITPSDVKKIFSSRFEGENDYSDFSCFFMDITINNERDIVNYMSAMYRNLDERVQYLSFMIKDFITIKSKVRNYACINSTFDRSYGQLPYSRFFLVFEKIPEEDIIFQFDDNYFNKGIINLKL